MLDQLSEVIGTDANRAADDHARQVASGDPAADCVEVNAEGGGDLSIRQELGCRCLHPRFLKNEFISLLEVVVEMCR